MGGRDHEPTIMNPRAPEPARQGTLEGTTIGPAEIVPTNIMIPQPRNTPTQTQINPPSHLNARKETTHDSSKVAIARTASSQCVLYLAHFSSMIVLKFM